MAIQYYMRAFNTTLAQYVDWVVNDTPDSTGTFSGYPTNQLINITVNRIVQSKVANFLKQNQSLGGTDGYFFHVNSYDWKNATAPILPPTTLVGFAVERGISPVAAISGATNASPIVINTSTPHGLSTGQVTTISGVTGNVAANGTWPIVFISTTSFSLTGSIGTGTYSAGTGTVYIPNDMSSLIWDEVSNVWRLATIIKNNPGDSVTLGVSQSLKVNNFILDGYLAIGLDPADTGAIRLSNNTYIFSESNPTGTDVQLIGADTLNRIKLGVNATDTVYVPGVVTVDGYIQHDGTGSNTAQTTGFIREQNSTNIVAFRGTAALAGSDIVALASSSNNVVLGDSVNTGVLYRTSNGNVHQFQTNSVARVEIGDPFIRFVASGLAGNPSILQSPAGSGISGQTLTIHAQDGGSGTSTGGILTLTSGTGAGIGGAGTLDLQTGGILQMRIFPDTNAGTTNGINNNNSILYFQNALRFDTAQTTPSITQDPINVGSTPGQTLTVQAQNSIGTNSGGGVLNLTSGTGTLAAGNVNIQTGGTNQIIVSPTFITPGTTTPTSGSVVIRGSLEVVGTTTTVDSTVVDIIGRVIHGNWADPVASPSVAVPSQVVGYSIHRGNISSVPRDGAAIIWTEGALNSGADGYWRHVTYPGDGIGTDNFTIANSLNAVGTMANDFAASSDPNPILGFLASTGSFRAVNNVAAVVGRTNQATTTFNLVATNGTATLPQATLTVFSTTGFSTPTGSLLIQSSAGTQTVTYTNTTGTTFTGVSGGTGTIVTGGIVAQTNASTTIAAGSNNVALPIGTINVASTTGFPSSGTIRVVSRTSASATAPPSVQVVAYTGIGATTFTGCTGGTGTMFTGDAVTSTPIPGISDLPLVGTDFGNRVLHGFTPTSTGNVINNTGHIFNTTTGFFYDFQVNSVSQVLLGQADVDASGFAETIAISPTVSNPRLIQTTLPNTGATNGFNLGVFAQAGQLQTGGSANNNGGLLVLSSGAQGTGGAGAAGIDGYVELRTGFTSKMRVFPTLALSAADNNSILYFENLFRVDLNQVNPTFRQDTTGSGTGNNFTFQAQNAATNGGNIVITSGTGSTTANAGKVQLQTGAVDRVVSFPTGSPAGLPSPGASNVPYTEFRDAGQGLFIVPVATGTTSIGFNSTVTTAQIAQLSTASTPSAPMTIQSQVTTAASGVGGILSLIAGNATGTTSTGGNAILTSGTGTTVAGNTQLQTGGVDRVVVHPTFTEFRDTAEALRITPVSAGTTQITFAATDTAAQINQTSTASTPSANMTIQSQVTTAVSGVGGTLSLIAGNATNTTSTGGNLNLASGTGTTTNGTVNLQPGGVTTASVVTNKFVLNKGWRRNVTAISTTYQVLVTDDCIAATTSTAYTVTMPAAPTTGDTYTFKDASGGAGTNILTISGNGVNIDGSASMVLNQAYAAVTLTYTGSQWSVT